MGWRLEAAQRNAETAGKPSCRARRRRRCRTDAVSNGCQRCSSCEQPGSRSLRPPPLVAPAQWAGASRRLTGLQMPGPLRPRRRGDTSAPLGTDAAACGHALPDDASDTESNPEDEPMDVDDLP